MCFVASEKTLYMRERERERERDREKKMGSAPVGVGLSRCIYTHLNDFYCRRLRCCCCCRRRHRRRRHHQQRCRSASLHIYANDGGDGPFFFIPLFALLFYAALFFYTPLLRNAPPSVLHGSRKELCFSFYIHTTHRMMMGLWWQ